MSRRIKIAVGLLLLAASCFAAFKTYGELEAFKKKLFQKSYDYFQVEVTECEYVGRKAPIGSEGQEVTANMYFGFYKLIFHVENLGTTPYYGNLEHIPVIDSGDENIIRIVFPSANEQLGIYREDGAMLPGKTSADVICYVEVREGTKMIRASYEAELDKVVGLEIALR